MPANQAIEQTDLVEAATAWLRKRLPPSWTIQRSSRPGLVDSALEIQATGVYATLAIEARRSFGPRDVERLLGSVGRTLRDYNPNLRILVVAPWLSARSQAMLANEGFNYLDLTGNALLRLDNPAVFVHTQGSAADPSPRPRGKSRVRGPKAGRLIRLLVDVRPPYGVSAIAATTGLAPGYVSQLLAALDDDALIERSARGAVESTDIEGLLRRWSDTYDVFKGNDTRTFIAPRGAADAIAHLPSSAAVTGSFAAARLAPVAAPALLCAYVEDPDLAASSLDLLPSAQGANVALLAPFDPVVWDRTSRADGVTYAAPSQVVVDCLTGNGRMPAEGEAAMEWLLANEDSWRAPALSDVHP